MLEYKCWICRRSEKSFLEEKNHLLTEVREQIAFLIKEEEDIVTSKAEELGFTKKNKDAISKLKCQSVTLSAVLENENFFLNSEPNLSILLDYCRKYNLQRKFKTVEELKNSFLSEPTKDKYSHDLYTLQNKKITLENKQNRLNLITTSFIEKTFNLSHVKAGRYLDLGFNFPKTINICPICSALFEESAKASFNLKESERIEAERLAYDDDDWGDEEDWY